MRPTPVQRGFTLLELLVVLVIVTLLVSFATLRLGDNRAAQLEREAQRLAALLEAAGDEAVLQGQELGLRLEPDGYRFLRYTPPEWAALEDDALLRPRRLPATIRLELRLDGLPPPPDADPQAPQIIVYSSGEHTPFELTLGAAETAVRYRLRTGLLGPVEVREERGS